MRALRPAAVAMLAALALSACGDEQPAVSGLCLDEPQPIQDALRAAPAGTPVRLADGTSIAQCVRRATSDADLQNLGVTLTTVADHLARRVQERDDADAARQLGYLAAATERGAGRTSGTGVELARRIGVVAARLRDLPPDVQRMLDAGLAQGARHG